MCSKPYQNHGCGQCTPCRINRKRLWVHRLMLELYNHSAAWFVTLTYEDSMLPLDGSVSRRACQLFLKRLRRSWTRTKIRYYIVGEYGELSGRPHYHAIIFGGPEDLNQADEWFRHAWPYGFVKTGDVTPQSAGYVAGYVLKSSKAPAPGLRLPFSLMSKRPGIGCGQVIDKAAAFYSTRKGAELVARLQDTTHVMRTEGKVQPLGRYLTDRLRLSSGLTKGEPPAAALVRAVTRLDDVDAAGGVIPYLELEASKRQQHAHIAQQRLRSAQLKKIL
ncbi:replication initiator protein [robinz microvirus RP_153]|nr:replication initiator protein [robinz microvirus RP_153]